MDHEHGSGSGSGSGSGNDSEMPMMMMNYFYASEHSTILFKGWHTMTWAEMLGSCIAVAVIGFIYEGIKVGRELLHERMTSHHQLSSSSSTVDSDDRCECGNRDDQSRSTDDSTKRTSSTIVVSGMKSHKNGSSRHPIFQLNHFIQTILHFIQLWFGLCLMLVFMTFNVYLCLAVTVGGAIGYYCFGWANKRRSGLSSTEICH